MINLANSMPSLPETSINPDDEWELRWSPYDEATYQAALDYILPEDVIVDIGAGDFRFSQRVAVTARWVYGIEIQERLIPQYDLPENLTCIRADALVYPYPEGVTAGVLLIRHCQHFREYAEKLKTLGARRLITNTRWGMSVEEVNLCTKREAYEAIDLGWYACWCGSVGFKPGPAERLSSEIDQYIHEVVDCPKCRSTGE